MVLLEGAIMENAERSSVFAAIRFRRSVRDYDPRPIEDWKLQVILEAARLAPSSTNSEPWRLVVVKDAGTRETIAGAVPRGIAKHSWLKDAPVIIVLCTVPVPLQKAAQLIGKDYHLVDMGIIGEHVVLTAADLGIGSCWVGWIDKKSIAKLLQIPWEIVTLISLGYPKNQVDMEALREQNSMAEPTQVAGDQGIGGIGANKRKAMDDIVFYETGKK
jgi:nitroreductase